MAVAFNYSSVASLASLAASIDGSATTIQVNGATGWPAATPFTAVLDPDTASEEIVTVTAVAGTSWTVLRGQDGSPALPHGASAVVAHKMVSRDLRLARQHEDASSGVHGRDSALVATEDTQTLKNKTISGADNTITNLSATQLTTGTVPDARLSSNVVKTTGAQTLTGKTLDGDDNTFRDIPQSAVTGLPTVAGDAASGKLLGRASISTNVECAGSPQLLVSLAFAAVSGRRYRVVFQGSFFRQSNESLRSVTTLHHVAGSSISAYNSTPPTNGFILQRLADATQDNLVVPLHLEDTFTSSTTGTVSVGATGARGSGSGVIEYSAGGSNTCYIAVYDAGPA